MLSKIVRVKIQSLLRRTNLLTMAEKIRYRIKVWSLDSQNRKFIRQNPDFVLPPPHLAYDAYSAPEWDFYKSSGEGTATFLAATMRKYCNLSQASLSVYEWGCGPGRVIRHLPSTLDKTTQVYGSDYNNETIAWCSKHIENVSFLLNELNPPLLYEDNKFDFIYCISVFTHLSEATGLNWASELYRILKPNGILLVTTAGDNTFETEMLSKEKRKYLEQGIVVRGDYEEGKKMFLARHNPKYVREKLLSRFQFIEHVPAGFPFIAQDFWLVRKTK